MKLVDHGAVVEVAWTGRYGRRLEGNVELNASPYMFADNTSGQSFALGKASAMYSQMASESHTTRSPSRSAGTFPEGECAAAATVRVPGGASGMMTSL